MNTTNSNPRSAAELVAELAAAKEEANTLHHIKRNLALQILVIVLPAALQSASAGNVTMRNAVLRASPYIKKLLS